MYKKEEIIISQKNRKAQITVFMILGLILLFAAIFIIQISSKVQKETLIGEQEKVFNQIFKKEALRIYVEDCLQEQITEGITLLGKQGRIWNTQPGGTKFFQSENTGVLNTATGEKVYYGITREKYFPDLENAYPCNNNSNYSESPQFCQYAYPQALGFGILELRNKEPIEEDLKNFLFNRTQWCIENFTKTNISQRAQVTFGESNLQLQIRDDGITVKANYPLTFDFGGEEFFQLTNFDFFYPSNFGQLLKAAVIYPLQKDQNDLNFHLASEILLNPLNYSFAELYHLLGIEMKNYSLANGDNIFVFTPTESPIHQPEEYNFNIARQNRPPALDYVHRDECLAKNYDYLVIKEDLEYGRINITLFAPDADEDQTNYSFELSLPPRNFGDFRLQYPSGQPVTVPNRNLIFFQNNFTLSKEEVLNFPDLFNITVRSTDQHGLSDWQVVRFLVDRPLTTNLTLDVPYQFKFTTGESLFYNQLFPSIHTGAYIVSVEDPIFFNIIHPQESRAGFSQNIILNYNNNNIFNPEHFTFQFPESNLLPEEGKGCFSFPGDPESCNLNNYKNKIANWNSFVDSSNREEIGGIDGGHFKDPNTRGILSLLFNTTYCGSLEKNASSTAQIEVKKCMPHQNPEHPWAYPYHNYAYTLLPDGSIDYNDWHIDDSFNPFNATHTCCKAADNPEEWDVFSQSENHICFENPVIDCYGQILGMTDGSNKGYVLEQQIRTCDGERGNICNGDYANIIYSEGINPMICGNNAGLCRGIPTKCKNEPSWSLIDTDEDRINNAWCYGTLGCSQICENPKSIVADFLISENFNFLNYIRDRIRTGASNNAEVGFHCGCKTTDIDHPCDSNFDGTFEGLCIGIDNCQIQVGRG